MSICVMQGNMPWAIQGQLFETIPLLKGKHYFCNVLFSHMGDESIARERDRPPTVRQNPRKRADPPSGTRPVSSKAVQRSA